MSVTDPFFHDPAFGRDPWIGPGQPLSTEIAPDVALAELAATTRIFTGADTIAGDINLLPVGLDAYMSYVDNFGGFDELVARFGKSGAFLVSITIFGNRARCADVEPGAMHASDLPHWLDSVAVKDEFLPWVYTSASNMAACNAQIGSRKVIRWSAHYGSGPHVCGPSSCGFAQADWTQWDDHGRHGENIDRSIGVVLPSQPKPPAPEEIMAITAAELQGVPHVFVEAKDGSVWYTFQPQSADPGVQRAWNGGVANKQIAGLIRFAPAPK
jgi:hypothetical protein